MNYGRGASKQGNMNSKSSDGTNVMKRQIEYTPPRSWRIWLMGRPLSTADDPHQMIGKIIGLAVFASDALSFEFVALALIPSLLLVVFNASVTNQIPFYAIGMFLSFSPAQGGMARCWLKSCLLSPDEDLNAHGSTFTKLSMNHLGATICLQILVEHFTAYKDNRHPAYVLA